MKRVALISLILGTALALVPVASSMVLDGGSGGGGGVASAIPGGIDPATQAVLLRSKALAQFYDTGAVVTSGSNIDPATQAVLLRSKGLADYYGANGVTFHTDVLGGDGGASVAPASGSSDAFNWSPVLATTLAGMLLLAAAATAVTRRKHRLSY
jgi:hypothetical protein